MNTFRLESARAARCVGWVPSGGTPRPPAAQVERGMSHRPLLSEQPIVKIPEHAAWRCSECGRHHRFGVVFRTRSPARLNLICLPCVRWFGWGGRHRTMTCFGRKPPTSNTGAINTELISDSSQPVQKKVAPADLALKPLQNPAHSDDLPPLIQHESKLKVIWDYDFNFRHDWRLEALPNGGIDGKDFALRLGELVQVTDEQCATCGVSFTVGEDILVLVFGHPQSAFYQETYYHGMCLPRRWYQK